MSSDEELKDEQEDSKPLRLILHVGAGKTGTSSIQKTLRVSTEKLKEQGYWYLGRMLENAPIKLYSWQRSEGTEELLSYDKNTLEKQIVDVFEQSVPIIKKTNCHTLVWSNESFCDRGEGIAAAVKAIQCDSEVFLYVRRHDAWARSAYIQWGLKHKTYVGDIRTFGQWFDRKMNRFTSKILFWQERFPKDFKLRNPAGDVVDDFMAVAGIDGSTIEKRRMNETPQAEELVLRTLFNEQFVERVQPNKFSSFLTVDNVCFDQPINEYLDKFLPSAEDLKQVLDECSEDRRALDTLLVDCGQPAIDTTPLEIKPVHIDLRKITTAMFQMIVGQAKRIQKLEEGMEQLLAEVDTPVNSEPSSVSLNVADSSQNVKAKKSPVFIVSTGRSGSTLVQRLLNCHKDLVVWGEHHGFVEGLALAHQKMCAVGGVGVPQTGEENNGPQLILPTLSDPKAPLEWANPWSRTEFELKIRVFLNEYFGGRLTKNQRWGFKEILYNNMRTLNFLHAMFPQGRFILFRRDPIEVTRSKIFAFIKEKNWREFNCSERQRRVEGMLKEVRDHYMVYDKFQKEFPDLVLIADYESLLASPQQTIKMMLEHTCLDPSQYDWNLAEQVIGSVITKTKRDEELVAFIKQVDESSS